MADIQPFRGIRPLPDHAAKIACPPYDVISSEEAVAIAKGNELSFLHVIKPEIDLPPGTDLHSSEVYARGAENFQKLMDGGFIIRDFSPCLYVYTQRMGDHVQTGVVAGASLDEYEDGRIKKHELTRPDKEDDRTRHIDSLNANTGPVFLTYKSNPDIEALVGLIQDSTATYSLVDENGVAHTLRVVDHPDMVDQIQKAFSKVPYLYIADGHHRSAAAARVRTMRRDANPKHTGREAYNCFLAVLFPHNQMKILGYNRVVKDLAGMNSAKFIKKLKKIFDVSTTSDPIPRVSGNFGMLLDGTWYMLAAKPGNHPEGDPVRGLDVSILQENLLAPILGITDPRTDQRIDFVGGIRGISELERRCEQGWAAAFVMYPTTIDQLMAVADAGQIMPPKSTWFEPKLRSGIVVRMLDE